MTFGCSAKNAAGFYFRLMSGKVVHDDVDFLVGRLGGNHVGQKGNKLRAGVTGGGLSNHLAGAHIKGGVERKRAVAVVFEPWRSARPGESGKTGSSRPVPEWRSFHRQRKQPR